MRGRTWMMLGLGLAVGGASMFLLALRASPEGPADAGHAAPLVPVDWVPTTQDWNAAGNGSGEAPGGIRIAELGSTLGAVHAGGSTDLCARVVDGDGRALPRAVVDFTAEEGRIEDATVEADAAGLACTRFAAPTQPGQILIQATARFGGNVSSPVRNLLEIVGTEPAPHEHGQGAKAPGLVGVLGVGGGPSAAAAWHRFARRPS